PLKHTNKITMNSYIRGNNFEIETLRVFMSHDVEVYRIRIESSSWAHLAKVSSQDTKHRIESTSPRPGDGGVDLFGNYEGFLILVQCKNRRRNIGPEILRDLEGVLSRYHNDTTIGILVVPFKENYTAGTIRRARTSRYNIILTDVRDLYLDLVWFVEERQIDDLVRFIEERIRLVEERSFLALYYNYDDIKSGESIMGTLSSAPNIETWTYVHYILQKK
ncbi:202_t:CDS:2, partial [Funneliformis caledonium]